MQLMLSQGLQQTGHFAYKLWPESLSHVMCIHVEHEHSIWIDPFYAEMHFLVNW